MKGPGILSRDNIFRGQLHVSQQKRALFENLQSSKKVGTASKALTLPKILEHLDQVVRIKGEEGLSVLRDRARVISIELGMEKEFEKLNRMVEGTKSKIETGKPLPTRDEDSHDVLGTYQIVSNRSEMGVVPGNPDHLLQTLQYRHKIILSARPHKNPREFKDKNNRAGDTEFVDHKLVRVLSFLVQQSTVRIWIECKIL